MYGVRVGEIRAAACVARVRSGMGRNLGDAAEFLRDGVRRDIGVQGPPRSEPGKPPRRDTGDLQRSYTFQVDTDSLRARVSSDDEAAYYLEVGTDRMQPRPHLLSATVSRSPELASILCRPIR